jgi:hypothetical protein
VLYFEDLLVKRYCGKLRNLFSPSGCQQRQEGAREIYSTNGETSRRKEETA